MVRYDSSKAEKVVINDILLQKKVSEELASKLQIDDTMIGVEVHHGIVKLAGHLSSAEARQRARQIAERSDGVLNVVMDVDLELTTKAAKPARDLAMTVD